jgi:hypothetical protein
MDTLFKEQQDMLQELVPLLVLVISALLLQLHQHANHALQDTL